MYVYGLFHGSHWRNLIGCFRISVEMASWWASLRPTSEHVRRNGSIREGTNVPSSYPPLLSLLAESESLSEHIKMLIQVTCSATVINNPSHERSRVRSTKTHGRVQIATSFEFGQLVKDLEEMSQLGWDERVSWAP